MQRFTIFWASVATLTIPTVGLAKPPAHAPAHGYRAKQAEHHEPEDRGHAAERDRGGEERGGVRVVFDSERGISIAVGFPGVYFHAGDFYRRHDGSWQKSARADGGWTAIASARTPGEVRRAHDRSGAARIRASD